MVMETFRYLKDQIENLDIFQVVYDDTQHIKVLSKKFDGCEKVLVFGTGGSSLGGKCLVNFQSMIAGESPEVIFVENTDSLHFLNVIRKCNPQKTGVIVISKSGRTTETLMLFLTLCQIWPEFDYEHRALAITELSENNDLRILAESKRMEVVEHNPRIGGRFSVFSVVGLLPAILGGVDIDAFIGSAQNVLDEILSYDDSEAMDCPIFADVYSLYQDVFKDGKIDQHVIMTYSDMLEDYGKWAVQLISESLGKTETFGITPVRAVGTVDQHSMLQLFLGGPSNKFFTVILARHNAESPIVDSAISSNVIKHLNGHTIHELMYAHANATIKVLEKKAPVRVFEFDHFDITTLGTLMMNSFIEVLVIAKLAGINPFDQPAVEESKKIAMNYLNDQGRP